eukprot:jgi/Undpi1/2068/HiC_scaffold_12.g05454.m1
MIPLQLSRTLAFGLRWSFRSNVAIASPPHPFLKVSHPSSTAAGSAGAATCGCRRTATATATSASNLLSYFDGSGGGEGGEARVVGGFALGGSVHLRQGGWRWSRRQLAKRRLLPLSFVRSLSSKRATSTPTAAAASSLAQAAAEAGGGGGGGGAGGRRAPQQRDLDGGPPPPQLEKEHGEEGELDEPIAGDGDDLIASLVDEFVWTGDDDIEEDEEEEEDEGEWEELDGRDLTQLGIEFMEGEDTVGAPEQLGRELGRVSVENEQEEFDIDPTLLQAKLRKAMEVLGCEAWDVGAVFTTDKEVSSLNSKYRGMKKSTDILSFPMHDMSDNPGVLPKVRFAAEMDLGDMFISLAYVNRQIARDREEAEEAAASAAASATKAEGAGAERGGIDVADSPDHEWWDEERGVSGAMSRVFDVQERASMLLVHGLIHLLGYDHETEQDYEAMVELEEKVLAAVFVDTVGASP